MPRSKKNRKRSQGRPRGPRRQVQCFAFKGTLAAGTSVDLSITSVSSSDPMRASCRLMRIEIEFAGCSADTDRVAPCLLQADFYDSHQNNAWLHCITHMVTKPKRIVYRWPSRLDDIAVSELSQTFCQLDCSCIATGHTPILAYFGRVWLSTPQSAATITCVSDAFGSMEIVSAAVGSGLDNPGSSISPT